MQFCFFYPNVSLFHFLRRIIIQNFCKETSLSQASDVLADKKKCWKCSESRELKTSALLMLNRTKSLPRKFEHNTFDVLGWTRKLKHEAQKPLAISLSFPFLRIPHQLNRGIAEYKHPKQITMLLFPGKTKNKQQKIAPLWLLRK